MCLVQLHTTRHPHQVTCAPWWTAQKGFKDNKRSEVQNYHLLLQHEKMNHPYLKTMSSFNFENRKLLLKAGSLNEFGEYNQKNNEIPKRKKKKTHHLS